MKPPPTIPGQERIAQPPIPKPPPGMMIRDPVIFRIEPLGFSDNRVLISAVAADGRRLLIDVSCIRLEEELAGRRRSRSDSLIAMYMRDEITTEQFVEMMGV